MNADICHARKTAQPHLNVALLYDQLSLDRYDNCLVQCLQRGLFRPGGQERAIARVTYNFKERVLLFSKRG
jgi:hypothetical protein